mmetsp:Transcript_98193/g.273269  ORF Transcript_98193/g.273269 Transcript_98193/m.273269 type:complete len:157 (-) Transcript_98193:194-664(-)
MIRAFVAAALLGSVAATGGATDEPSCGAQNSYSAEEQEEVGLLQVQLKHEAGAGAIAKTSAHEEWTSCGEDIGECQNKCDPVSGCYFFCEASLGASCKSGRCMCKPGSCAVGGRCLQDTGGTCTFMGCDGWRGAECHGGRCLCKAGTVNSNGKCVR